MTTEQDFINAINAAANWRPPALAFADWLRERGDEKRAHLLDWCVKGDYQAAAVDCLAASKLGNGRMTTMWRNGNARRHLLMRLGQCELIAIGAAICERNLRYFEPAGLDDTLLRKAIHCIRYSTAEQGDASRPSLKNLHNLRRPRSVRLAVESISMLSEVESHASKVSMLESMARDVSTITTRAFQAIDATFKGHDAERERKVERNTQIADFLLQFHFSTNDWLMRQHRRDLSQ